MRRGLFLTKMNGLLLCFLLGVGVYSFSGIAGLCCSCYSRFHVDRSGVFAELFCHGV